MNRLIFVFFISLLPACQRHVVVEPSTSRPLKADVTICEIASHPERFVGQRVVVEGCITTDGQEYSALTQAEYCAAGGLSPNRSPDYGPKEWSYLKPGQKACGTFAGTFRGLNMFNSRVLEIDDAQNVRITSLTSN